MCLNTKNQCRYCEAQAHVRTEFCSVAETKGRVCLAAGFQTQGNAYTRTEDGYQFNADKLAPSKFKTVSCDACHKIELQVLKSLPGPPQSLYEYNSDRTNREQHLNPGVLDGTSQVVRLGWPAWRERLHQLNDRYIKYGQPKSHSGLTDPEDESDDDSVTLGEGVTPPSPPESPASPANARTRSDLLRMQQTIRDGLNEKRLDRYPNLEPLDPTEAMVRWGEDHPILRIKPRSASLAKIRQAMKAAREDFVISGGITSTQERGIIEVADRHEVWENWVAKWEQGKAGIPPQPVQEYKDIDRMYRARYGLPTL